MGASCDMCRTEHCIMRSSGLIIACEGADLISRLWGPSAAPRRHVRRVSVQLHERAVRDAGHPHLRHHVAAAARAGRRHVAVQLRLPVRRRRRPCTLEQQQAASPSEMKRSLPHLGRRRTWLRCEEVHAAAHGREARDPHGASV